MFESQIVRLSLTLRHEWCLSQTSLKNGVFESYTTSFPNTTVAFSRIWLTFLNFEALFWVGSGVNQPIEPNLTVFLLGI